MIPVLEGFDIVKLKSGWGVTTIYDLFHLNAQVLLCEFPTKEEAIQHKQKCFENALREYERCMKKGCSFPYND